MSALTVTPVPCLLDNYAYLLRDEVSGVVAVVDPSDAAAVEKALDERGWSLSSILNTHHHWDHVGGNESLKRRYNARVVCSQYDRWRVPGVDQALGEGEVFSLGKSEARILEVPGHTLGAIAYYFEQARAVFTGDTLFSAGCGRLFEGTAANMWESLGRLRELPDDTLLYCGHEYTRNNLKFALSLDPESKELRRKLAEVESLCRNGKPTIPSTMGEEKRLNPFLKAADPKRFAEIRSRKDDFQ